MAPNTGFVHLHVHTEHSALDGLAHLDDACAKVAMDGNPALAITDHGTMSGSWKFSAIARQIGIKPIIGTEAYLAISADWHAEPSRFNPETVEVARDDETSSDIDEEEVGKVGGKITKTKRNQHITLLARNAAGWENLTRISNAAAETFKGKPLMDFQLIKENSEGLIALTGCLGGPVLGPMSRGNEDEAEANLKRIIDAVGHDNVYVEIMEHGIDIESAALPKMAALAARYGLSLVATNDAHYVNAEDAETHAAWLTIQSGKALSDPKRFQFHGEGFHLRTEAEMRALRDEDWWQEAVSNTIVVADRCEDVVPAAQMRLPHFTAPDGFENSRKYLIKLVQDGAEARFGLGSDGKLPEDVRDRLNTEIKVIAGAGFVDYFLIVWDVIQWSRANGIRVGPGRGSAAGSLISYCLGIVQVDPLQNHLLFERFLEPGRAGMPDIDVDFEQGRRNEVLQYLAERWGRTRVARIGSFSAHKTRRALRDAGKLLEIRNIGDTLSKAVPIAEGGKPYTFVQLENTADQAGERFRELLASFEEPGQTVYNLARGFADTVNGESIHACGTLISDVDLNSLIPLRHDRSKSASSGLTTVTQWDGVDIDQFGMLKLDVLGLRNLDVVSRAVEYIHATTGETIDPDNLPHPDVKGNARVEKTWELLRSGRTSGVFQMDSTGMQNLARQIQPGCLADLSAIVALFRPGPLSAGMHTLYANRKAGIQDIDYSIFTKDPVEQEAIASVLGDTYGTFVYQEQLMRLGTVVSGFDVAMRSKLRKAVGKKSKSVMNEVGIAFRKGAPIELRDETTGEIISPVFRVETAQTLFEYMQGSAEYLFNAAHSYAYAQLAYMTAYLKANWPAEYGAAILAIGASDEKRSSALRALREEGITVQAPDVNRSRAETFPDGDSGVLLGLSEIKGVGDAGASVAAEREAHGEFRSISHLMHRVVDENGKPLVDVGSVEGLIEAGALDAFGPRLGLMKIARAARAHEFVTPEVEWGILERSTRQRRRLGVVMGEHPVAALWEASVDAVETIMQDDRGNDILRHVTKLSNIPTTDRSNTTTMAVLADWVERPYSKGIMANFTLESEDTVIRGVAWDKTLKMIHEHDSTPTVGNIVLVEGQVTVRERDVEDEEGNVVETVVTQEIMASRVSAVDVDDGSKTPTAVPITTPLRAYLALAYTARSELEPTPETIAESAPVPLFGPGSNPAVVEDFPEANPGAGLTLPVVIMCGVLSKPDVFSSHSGRSTLVGYVKYHPEEISYEPPIKIRSDARVYLMKYNGRACALLAGVPKSHSRGQVPPLPTFWIASEDQLPEWQELFGEQKAASVIDRAETHIITESPTENTPTPSTPRPEPIDINDLAFT